MAASTYFHREAIIASVGTTAHWFKVGSTGVGGTLRQRYAALEIILNSTTSTGWVNRSTSASSTGANGNVIVPKGKTGRVIPYSTKISIKASAAATVYVRGIPRWAYRP